MSKPYLFMAHVSYSGGVRSSARQFDCNFMEVDEIAKRGIGFGRYPCGSSLLANSFNGAWATALNGRESGKDIRWFAMLHDDVVPEDWWVRTLIDDLEASGADMLAALVPLKDASGATSTCIDNHKDNFSWERRITLTEAEKLPPIFTAADCGFADRMLLANTGCWIARFDSPIFQQTDEQGNLRVFFTINDRIRREPNSGLWQAQVEPEDWFFSRKVQELGGKVAVTRNVKLCHHGMIPFPNFPIAGEVYGTKPYDEAFAENAGYTPIGEVRPTVDFTFDTQEFPDVPGWLNDDEGRLLAKYAEGHDVLEIGSYCGRSTIWMARVAESVHAVDTWDGRGTPCPRNTLDPFMENVTRHGVLDKITTVKGPLASVKRGETNGIPFEVDLGKFGFAFIDGDHTRVQEDVNEVLPLLLPGARIAFHDYQRPTDPLVTATVDKLISEGATIVERAGTVIVLELSNERTEELVWSGGESRTYVATY